MRPVPSRCAIFATSLSIVFAACVLTLPAPAAAVQGKLESISMITEEARRFREHQALERGVPFDPKAATAPLTLYQIKPTGVFVE